MMRACGADDVEGVLLRQMFRKRRFQMIDDTSGTPMSQKNLPPSRQLTLPFLGYPEASSA
jgi:hypothetical protein